MEIKPTRVNLNWNIIFAKLRFVIQIFLENMFMFIEIIYSLIQTSFLLGTKIIFYKSESEMGNLELLSIFYVAVTTSVTLLTIFLCVLKICFKSKVRFRQVSLNFQIVFSSSCFSAKRTKMSITTQGKNCRFKTVDCNFSGRLRLQFQFRDDQTATARQWKPSTLLTSFSNNCQLTSKRWNRLQRTAHILTVLLFETDCQI